MGQFQWALMLQLNHDSDTIRQWDTVYLDDGMGHDRTITSVMYV